MKRCIRCGLEFVPKRKEQTHCSVSCASVAKGMKRKGQKTGKQKNKAEYKRQINRDGYVMLYAAHHPFADGRLMIAEHIAVMEIAIGRRIKAGECVHHINSTKTDNRLENLELAAWGKHSKKHATESVPKRRRNANGRLA